MARTGKRWAQDFSVQGSVNLQVEVLERDRQDLLSVNHTGVAGRRAPAPWWDAYVWSGRNVEGPLPDLLVKGQGKEQTVWRCRATHAVGVEARGESHSLPRYHDVCFWVYVGEREKQ